VLEAFLAPRLPDKANLPFDKGFMTGEAEIPGIPRLPDSKSSKTQKTGPTAFWGNLVLSRRSRTEAACVT